MNNGPGDALDTAKLVFGKHKGKTPREVACIDPEYVVWMYDATRPTPCSRELALLCEEGPKKTNRAYSEEEIERWAEDVSRNW
jgi:hypothetical protein